MPLRVLLLLLFLVFPLAAQTGSIRVSRQVGVGSWNSTDANRELAGPYFGCRVDGGALLYPTDSVRPTTVAGLSTGDHLLTCELQPTFTPPYGKIEWGECVAAELSECEVASWPNTPTITLSADGIAFGTLSLSVSVTAGNVTEVAIAHTLTAYGAGAAATGGVDGAANPITSPSCTGAGSITAARDTAKSGDVFTYFDLAMGADVDLTCEGSWPNNVLKWSGSNQTIWGWSSLGPVDIRRTDFEINQLDDSAVCHTASNIIFGGWRQIGELVAGRGGIFYSNGSSSNNCSGVAMSTFYQVGHTAYENSAADIWYALRNSIHSGTLAASQFFDARGEAFILQRDAESWVVHHNHLHSLENRAPWVKWCATGSSCTTPRLPSRGGDDKYQMWFVENIQHGTLMPSTGTMQAVISGDSRFQAQRNMFVADPNTADGADKIVNRIWHHCGNDINDVTEGVNPCVAGDGAEAFFSDNVTWSAYNAMPYRIRREADLSNMAEWEDVPTLLMTRTAIEAANHIVKVAGVWPRDAKTTTWVTQTTDELAKFVPTTRIQSACDDFTGWADAADMSIVVDGTRGNVCQLGASTAVAFTAEDDPNEYADFYFKTSANPAASGTFAQVKNSGGTVVGRIEVTPTGDYRFDNDDAAGGEISLTTGTAGNTWHHFRLVNQAKITGTCTLGLNEHLDPHCYKLEAGIADGAVSGTNLSLKDGFYTVAGTNIASLEFLPLTGATTWIDQVQASPTTWCDEGGCEPAVTAAARGFFSVRGTLNVRGSLTVRDTPGTGLVIDSCATESARLWSLAGTEQPFVQTASETAVGDTCQPFRPALRGRP